MKFYKGKQEPKAPATPAAKPDSLAVAFGMHRSKGGHGPIKTSPDAPVSVAEAIRAKKRAAAQALEPSEPEANDAAPEALDDDFDAILKENYDLAEDLSTVARIRAKMKARKAAS